VFIDWSQNADFKTTVAVYSLRAKSERPLVSMPVRWSELEKPKKLAWEPDEAIARVKKLGDLFAPVLTRTPLPVTRAAPRRRTGHGTRNTGHLPKADSQSGRRLFVVTKTESGNEVWMEMRGKFRRWILRPDREGTRSLIAMPAGEFAIDPAYYRGEVPKEWKARVSLGDSGAYEIIEGSLASEHLRLWFNGKVLAGEWTLDKIEKGEKHRSWRLAPSSP
jgi:hypothetical protein